MKEKTKNEYLSLAEHFLKTRFEDDENITLRTLTKKLESCASEYRPDYWRRLRKALEVQQREAGYNKAAKAIAATKNPLTLSKDAIKANKDKIKKKQVRAKSINESDENKLFEYIYSKKNYDLYCYLAAVKLTGCRPTEVESIKYIGEGRFFINGAKANEKGDRGSDRIIELSPDDAEGLKSVIDHLHMSGGFFEKASGKKSTPQALMKAQLDTFTAALWPRRSCRPTMYTFRHQLGSDLKASGMGRVEQAYVMGHQATASIDVYGNSRKARSKRNIRPAANADLSKIRVTHSEPPKPQRTRTKTNGVGLGM